MTRLNGWLVVGVLLGTAIYAIAEEITLTTYYPSPRGVYQELKTAGDLIVGDITNPPGARLHVVQEGTTAPALRVDDELSDTSPLVVDDEGNVGIGTASPTQKLDVIGYVRGATGLCIGDDCRQSWPGAGGFSNIQVFNSSGSFTVPDGVTKIMAELWGGGGGGGGCLSYYGGGGAGGGGYGKGSVSVTPSSTVSITVGTGGEGGENSGGDYNGRGGKGGSSDAPLNYPGENGANGSGDGGKGGKAGEANGGVGGASTKIPGDSGKAPGGGSAGAGTWTQPESSQAGPCDVTSTGAAGGSGAPGRVILYW